MRRRVMWRLHKDFGWNYQQIGDAFQLSRMWISKLFTDVGLRLRSYRYQTTVEGEPASRHYKGVVKRSNTAPPPAAKVEPRAPIKPPAPAGKHPVYGAPIRRFEEGTLEMIIERALTEVGQSAVCQRGRGRKQVWMLNGKTSTFDAVISVVDKLRAKQGFPPLAIPKTRA